MLKIRLQRVGRKNVPVFRLVLTDSQNSTKSGRYLEVLGHFDARDHDKQTLDAERVKHWISVGAQPSDTVHNFLITKKVIEGKKRNVLPRKSPPVKAAAEGEAAPAAAAPAPVAAATAPTEAPKA